MKLLPWRERGVLPALRSDLDDWMESFFSMEPTSRLPEVFQRGMTPAVNLGENAKEFSASFELPGLEEKDLDVQLVGNQLIVSGERKWEDEKKDKEFYRVEAQYGSFRRAVALPEGLNLDADAVRASFDKGVLEVTIPKLEPRPVAKIKVAGNKKK